MISPSQLTALLATARVEVTGHALARFVERVRPATTREVEASLRASHAAGKRMRRLARQFSHYREFTRTWRPWSFPEAPSEAFAFSVRDGAVFLCVLPSPGVVRAVSVFAREALERLEARRLERERR